MNIKLDVGPEVIAALLQQCTEPLEAEREVLMVQRPAICTDPSPDVARFQSIMDFRKKMWQRREFRARESGAGAERSYRWAETKTQSMRMSESRLRFPVPEELQELCERECKGGIE
jgi:hypothetical protein